MNTIKRHNKKHIHWVCFFGLLTLTACGGRGGGTVPTSTATPTTTPSPPATLSPTNQLTITPPPAPVALPDNPVTVSSPLQRISTAQGILALNVAFGSGAFHAPADQGNILYTITDRGPVIPCKDAKAVFGNKNLCKDKGGKIFLLPGYTPAIYKLRLGKMRADILEMIPLSDASGQPLTGVTNPLQSASTEKAYSKEGVRIPYDASGLDPEALVRLRNGTFWVADEYGPSLVHVATNGRILERIVPQAITDDLVNSSYPVLAGLPNILRKRAANRGIEALALAVDETRLFAMMQSPLANPGKSTFDKSRHVRLLQYSLDAQGNLGSASGEFIYSLDARDDFVNNGKRPRQSQITVTDMAALDNGDLLVAEHTRSILKLYRVDMSSATNILGMPFDNKTTTSLEETKDLAELNIVPVSKQLIYHSLMDNSGHPVSGKIEGIAVLDNTHIALINDNDFGTEGVDTRIQVITLQTAL